MKNAMLTVCMFAFTCSVTIAEIGGLEAFGPPF